MAVKIIDPRYYGASPITQPSGSSQAAVTVSTITTAAITTTTNAYGYATTTQADNIAASVANCVTLVNALRSALVTLGLIKGSA
jgi:hypothetical protein